MSLRVRSAIACPTVARALLALFLAALSAHPLRANPVPGVYGVGFDVHPYTAEGCQPPDPIPSCDQIRQYCPQVGDLAFDVYAWSVYFPTVELHHLDGSLDWPADWEFLAFENCLGGEATLAPRSGGLDFTITSPGTVTLNFDPVWVGRLRVWADSPGRVMESTWVRIDDNFETILLPAYVSSTCYQLIDCESWGSLCGAHYSPSVLQLSVEQEERSPAPSTPGGPPPAPMTTSANSPG